jgi:plastocyanin
VKTFITILIIIIVAAGIWYLTRPATDSVELGEPPISVVSPNPSAAPEEPSRTKSFTVTGSNFKFDPAELRVQEGDSVEITFVNAGGMHDFVLDAFNARTEVIQAGEQQTIRFTADKKGSFEYYCSVGSHRQMGMVGTLIVE